jgi:hypothetical protein
MFLENFNITKGTIKKSQAVLLSMPATEGG